MYGDFEKVVALARESHKERDGIGKLQEKLLHAALKFYVHPDETHHEIPLPCGAVADIFDGEKVIEIQNGNFSPFRLKLRRLLEEYPVTVIYPLPREKRLFWVTPETGETAKPRRSNKKGRFSDAAPELLYISEMLFHPNLTLQLWLIDMDEYKLADGYGKDRKKRAHRLERVPVKMGEIREIRNREDLKSILPPLPETFTAKEFLKAMGLKQGRKGSAALKLFVQTGIFSREKQGNAYIYRII